VRDGGVVGAEDEQAARVQEPGDVREQGGALLVAEEVERVVAAVDGVPRVTGPPRQLAEVLPLVGPAVVLPAVLDHVLRDVDAVQVRGDLGEVTRDAPAADAELQDAARQLAAVAVQDEPLGRAHPRAGPVVEEAAARDGLGDRLACVELRGHCTHLQ
jgi:hypothetical protein